MDQRIRELAGHQRIARAGGIRWCRRRSIALHPPPGQVPAPCTEDPPPRNDSPGGIDPVTRGRATLHRPRTAPRCTTKSPGTKGVSRPRRQAGRARRPTAPATRPQHRRPAHHPTRQPSGRDAARHGPTARRLRGGCGAVPRTPRPAVPARAPPHRSSLPPVHRHHGVEDHRRPRTDGSQHSTEGKERNDGDSGREAQHTGTDTGRTPKRDHNGTRHRRLARAAACGSRGHERDSYIQSSPLHNRQKGT